MERRAWLWCGVCLAVLAVAARGHEEKRYQGKTAKEWIRIVKDKDSPQRKDGVEVLRSVGPIIAEEVGAKEVVAALVPVLKDKDALLRGRAADALGNLSASAKAAVPALIEALQDEEDYVRTEAAQALGDIGKAAQAAVPALVAALKDKEAPVRKAAAESLKKIDPEAAKKAGVK
jgi:HEAT repeat protein